MTPHETKVHDGAAIDKFLRQLNYLCHHEPERAGYAITLLLGNLSTMTRAHSPALVDSVGPCEVADCGCHDERLRAIACLLAFAAGIPDGYVKDAKDIEGLPEFDAKRGRGVN